MKLWIDADGAPPVVKEICFRVSDRLKVDTVLVANGRVTIPAGYVYLTAIRVDGSCRRVLRSLALPTPNRKAVQ